MKTLIFDQHIGLLQYVIDGEADHKTAMEVFDSDVGVNPLGEDLEDLPYRSIQVSDTLADKWIEWQEGGGKGPTPV